jgi:hypothetical protein
MNKKIKKILKNKDLFETKELILGMETKEDFNELLNGLDELVEEAKNDKYTTRTLNELITLTYTTADKKDINK